MKTHDAAIIAAVPIELGVIVLLAIVPILAVCTWLILRSTRRISEQAEAIVRSAEESHIIGFLEQNGPAIIRRLGSGKVIETARTPHGGSTPLLRDSGDVLEMETVDAEDDYGKAGIDEEFKLVVTRDTPEPNQPEPQQPLPAPAGFTPLGS